jgi:hypothetical protein
MLIDFRFPYFLKLFVASFGLSLTVKSNDGNSHDDVSNIIEFELLSSTINAVSLIL